MTEQSAVTGKLEFKLPEAQDQFQLAIDGHKWFSVVWDLDQELRSRIKHEAMSEGCFLACKQIRNSLHNKMEEKGLSFD